MFLTPHRRGGWLARTARKAGQMDFGLTGVMGGLVHRAGLRGISIFAVSTF